MKYKVKLEAANLFFMTLIFILLVFTCILWLVLRKYLNFTIYIVLTLILIHMYYFQCYFIEDKYFVIKMGFCKLKIKYSNISDLELTNNKVSAKIWNMKIRFYPEDCKKFYDILKNKIEVK